MIFSAPSLQAADCQWVETTGESVVENVTPAEARQSALNRARSRAVEDVSGVNISGNTLVKDFVMVSDLVQAIGSGYIVKEEVLNWETSSFQEKRDLPPVSLYRVKIKSCVVRDSPKDPYFAVKGELNRQVFMAGEEAGIKASCAKDCYLTILNLTAENRIRVLLPNEYEPSRLIKAGASYSFPAQGMSLEMQNLPGHKKDAEAFVLIATKERLDLNAAKGRELRAEEFYKQLLTIPADSRAEEILLYEVHAAPPRP